MNNKSGVAYTKEQYISIVDDIYDGLNFEGGPLEIKVGLWKKNRSLLQNKLYWMWMQEIANYSNFHADENAPRVTKDDYNVYLKEEFVTPTVKLIEGDKVKVYLSTSDMKVKPMCEYLEKIEFWCGAHGITITHPPDKRYIMYGEK